VIRWEEREAEMSGTVRRDMERKVVKGKGWVVYPR
jgi:hypothetical protein